MNYWMNQDDHWVMCFRGIEINIMSKAPAKDGVVDPNGGWLLEWWEPLAATITDNAGHEDMGIFYSWVAECMTDDGRIPVVLCKIDPETQEELEVWCIREAKIENFDCKNDTMTFHLVFESANQFKGE